jgi:hypothetical protein
MTEQRQWLATKLSAEFLRERYETKRAHIEGSYDWGTVSAIDLSQMGLGAQGTLGYAVASAVDADEQRRVARFAASAYAACFEAFDPQAPAEEVRVEQASFTIDPGGRSPTAMDWQDGFFLAHIVGADDLLERLCASDSRIPRPDDTRNYDMYHVHFSRALRLLWLGETDRAGELLVEAIADADPDREDLIAAVDSVLELAVPQMGLVAELAVGNVDAFHQKMEQAIDGHHRYFAKHRPNAPGAFASVPLWGLRAWAERRSMQVDIDSPYVPEPL